MSITVSDCLKLPALREATLVGGAEGINRTVTAVSVIEYPDINSISSDIVVGNELLISALVCIKDDVDQQCKLLRHLYSLGEACLVLYYVGIFIPKLDQRLIDTADELGFPLIAMPIGKMGFRYSDVVTEVAEQIYKDRKQDRYFVAEMVNQISQLSPQYQTMKSILRLISDRLRCTVLLTDRYLNPKASAAWPISNRWDFSFVIDILLEKKIKSGCNLEIQIHDRNVYIWDIPVVAKKQSFHLYILDEIGDQDMEDFKQAAEVIELFLNIWNRDVNYEGTDALVHAILSDQPAEKERLAAKMNIDVEPINTIWILKLSNKDGIAIDDNQRLACMRQLKQYLQERHKLVIVDIYSKYLISLTDDSLFDDTELSMATSLANEMQKDGIILEGVICQGVENTVQARSAYLLSDANWDAAQRIYKDKNFFTLGEIRFVERCAQILRDGESQLKNAMNCLNDLQATPDNDGLIDTLCTYLLDAGANTQKTGSIMYLHKNTVKYRLNKIRSTLSYDLTQLPEAYELYQAAALYRLLYEN